MAGKTGMISRLLDALPFIGKLRSQIRAAGAYPPGHYYSPIPSPTDIEASLNRRIRGDVVKDIDLRKDSQQALLHEFKGFYEALPFPEDKQAGSRYYFNQDWFCYSDAIFLYCFLRRFSPKKIIEVGSGYSSAVMLDTMDRHPELKADIIFIEPFPERLKELVSVEKTPGIELLQIKVQEVDLARFRELNPGDLLFVDSSHVMKFGSDLHFLLFEVLPELPAGVHVHFHDIFFPFEYPAEWMKKGLFWNECYLLRAFLAGNREWEITFFNHFVNVEFQAFIEKQMPLCRKNFGGSLYLKKVEK